MEWLSALFGGPFGPFIIFLLRICDVSLGTLRMLLIVRHAKFSVPIIGFFEVLIWIFAISTAMQHMTSVGHVLGYACGFAAGNSFGMWLETKLGYGFAILHIISRDPSTRVTEGLRKLGYRASAFFGQDPEGEVELVYCDVNRREVNHVIEEVYKIDSTAMVAVQEPKSLYRGWVFGRRRK